MWESLLQNLLGGVGGTVGNGLQNWLGGLFGGNGVASYPGSQWDSKATDLYTDLYNQAQAQSNPNFTTTELNPAQVDYFKTLANNAVDAPEYGIGQLNQDLIGQLENYDPSQLGDAEKVQDNEALKAILNGNLETLQKKSQEGFDETDRMMNAEVLREAANQSSRMGDAITRDAQERGVAGGGQELANRLLASQSAAQAGQMGGLQLAQEARGRKDQALGQANALGSQMRAQDVDISKSNADFTNQFLQQNVAAQNTAKQWNAATNNDRTIQNTNIKNNQQQNQWGAQNDANKFNTANQFDASKFNATNQNEINRWNAETSNSQNRDNTNIKNEFAVGNRDHALGVARANYEGKANNFKNVLTAGDALGQTYGGLSASMAQRAAGGAQTAKNIADNVAGGGSGNIFSNVLSGIFGGLFEEGGETPENVPYVVGEKGPEWGVNTPEGTVIAPMRTGNFVEDFMAMQTDPEAQQNTKQSRGLNRDKGYYFPPKFDLTKGK